MKNIYKAFVALAVTAGSLTTTSCIEETEPTSAASEEQVMQSEKSMASLLWGIPASLNLEDADGGHYRFGYGAIMHIRDIQTGDLLRDMYGQYNHFSNWAANKYQGRDYAYGQYIWNFSYKFVQTTNTLIRAINLETATDTEKGYLGAAYAFRAMAYLDLAREYEFLPNKVFPDGKNEDGNVVTGLTVPIVDENTTEQTATNNPRATREKMAEFILSDLNKAEELITNLTFSSKTLPHLDCVYGLKARYYMWLAGEDKQYYAQAAEYAQKAFKAAGISPMTSEDCLSKNKGFNDISKWMWGMQLVKENGAVQTGIVNWVSWMSNETTFGYAAAGPYVVMDANLYSKIPWDDFRKNEWTPTTFTTQDANVLAWYQEYACDLNNIYSSKNRDGILYQNMPAYTSFKFRPAQGNTVNSSIAGASAIPLMRVEEMYFIYAEALAHVNPAQGKAVLQSFMKKYRNANYTTDATTEEEVVNEIIFQKRIELWGEGQTFFDIKRLNMSVTRGYSDPVKTNWLEQFRFNTDGRPSWMNWVIVQTEGNTNAAVNDYNNPDPSDTYKEWSED